MKRGRFLLVAVLLAGLNARAQLCSFTNSPNTLIPDGNPAEYSSVIDVTGVAGWLTNVTVSLTVTGGYTGDFFSYLSCDNGGYAVLLNRVGQTTTNAIPYEDVGLRITLDDRAATDVHLYGGNSGAELTGTWQPDGRTNAPLNVVETDPRAARLDSFNERNPNGQWTLFITDSFGNGVEGTLVEWSLHFEAIPEPSAFALALLGGGILICARRRGNRPSHRH